MWGFLSTAVGCATVITIVILLQKQGLPKINVNNHTTIEHIVPTETLTPVDNPDPELSDREQKERAWSDLASAVNMFLEGETPNG